MLTDKEIYTDKPSTSLIQLINPIIVAGLFVLGIYSGDPMPVVIAVAMGVFIWFTRHTRYDLYSNALVIRYGTPRQRAVPISEIEQVVTVLGGKGLFVKRKGSGGLLIRPQDIETFKSRLEEILGSDNSNQELDVKSETLTD